MIDLRLSMEDSMSFIDLEVYPNASTEPNSVKLFNTVSKLTPNCSDSSINFFKPEDVVVLIAPELI